MQITKPLRSYGRGQGEAEKGHAGDWGHSGCAVWGLDGHSRTVLVCRMILGVEQRWGWDEGQCGGPVASGCEGQAADPAAAPCAWSVGP